MTSPRADIYFFHIPKTAGSSLASLIRNAYPQEEAIPIYEWYELIRMSRDEINRYRCYTGHFGTGLFSLLDRPVPTVTLLRDPFEQTVSHKLHGERAFLLDQPIKRLKRKLKRSLPWHRSTMDARFFASLVNYQTRMLGIEIDLKPFMGKSDDRYFAQLLGDMQREQSMDAILEQAKRRLDSMAVVGTVERFSESVGLICDLIGIPVPSTLPEENVSPGHAVRSRYRDSGKVSRDMAAYIDANTEYDRELYAYASRLLDARLAEQRAKQETASRIPPARWHARDGAERHLGSSNA